MAIQHLLIPHHRSRVVASFALRGLRIVATTLCLAACGPSVEDSIAKLGAGPDERAMGKHELILAGDEAVEPIIGALEKQDGNEVRPDLAEVLVARLLRLESKRIWSVLKHRLLQDPDSRVRGRIADKLGLHLRSEYFEVFLQAVSDPSPAVQTPSLHALANVLDQLTDEQTQTLRRLAAKGRRLRINLFAKQHSTWLKSSSHAGQRKRVRKFSRPTCPSPTPFTTWRWLMPLRANRQTITWENSITRTASANADSSCCGITAC